MNVKLVKLSYQFKEHLFEMMDEWYTYTNSDSPFAIFKNDYHDFDKYLNELEIKFDTDDKVSDSVFFLLYKDENKFIGASNIRHKLNEYLLNYGGHIGDGIRPTYRNKGYGNKLVYLSLQEAKKLNINKVLMTCNKNNIASRKTIVKNGGIFENEIVEPSSNKIIQRFWINL